jgi:transmembrane sensor
MESPARSPLNTQIYEEACAWFVACRGGDLDEAGRRDFDRWLRKSPEHLSAYLEVAAIWNEGPALDPAGKWDAGTLIAQAAADPENVVMLPGPTLPAPEPTVTLLPRAKARPWHVAVAASLALVAVLAGMWMTLHPSAPTYTTAVGEQRSIQLSDGSTVELNALSKIQVRYAEHQRTVDLLAGQALFHVAKDAARPFIVNADAARVRAVGTEFDVYKKRSGTVVTVIEGRVSIFDSQRVDTPAADRPPPDALTATASGEGQHGSAAVLLSAGEQLTVTPKGVHKAEHPNIPGATAWTQRQLVFDSATLSEVADEFNRYNTRQLIIDDPNPYDFHISGVFASTDPESLIRFLRERPGVQVTETPTEVRVAKRVAK